MADNAVLFKLVAKSVGVQYGIMPTFMAKPYSLLPGCSGHIHVSLRSASGENIFAAKTPREGDDAGDLKYFSQEAEWFLGGLLEGLPDIVPMLCPNINSYKRLLGGEAMYAPDTASYGYESRSASVRLIGPPLAGKSAARFEVRVPGADVSVCLYFACGHVLVGLFAGRYPAPRREAIGWRLGGSARYAYIGRSSPGRHGGLLGKSGGRGRMRPRRKMSIAGGRCDGLEGRRETVRAGGHVA